MNIRKKLVIVFVLLSVLPLISVGLVCYKKAKSTLLEVYAEKQKESTQLKISQLEHLGENFRIQAEFMDQAEDVHKLYEHLLHFHNKMGVQENEGYPIENQEYQTIWKESGSILRLMQEKFGFEDVYMICTKHGHVMYSNQKKEDMGKNLRYSTLKDSHLGRFWNSAKENDKISFSGLEPYLNSGKTPVGFVGSPIYKENVKIGLMVIQIPISALEAYVNVQGEDTKTVDSFILGGKGEIKTIPKIRKDGINYSLNENKKYLAWDLVKESNQSEKGSGIFLNPFTNSMELSYWQSFDFLGKKWKLITLMEADEASQRAETLFSINLLAWFLSFIVIVLVSIKIANSISKPLIVMAHSTEFISKGDFTQKFIYQGDDEIARASKALDDLVGVLRTDFKGISSQAQDLTNASEELNETSDKMYSQSSEIKKRVEGIKSSFGNVGKHMNSIATATEELSVGASSVSQSANEMSESVQLTSNNVQSLSHSIQTIASNARRTQEITDHACDISSKAKEEMESLGKLSKMIGEVTVTIKKFAEKTNLLALNASIEAASAGEAGKGFAVVASEVKQLADQSSAAADDVSQKILSMQNGSKVVIETIQNVLKVVLEIQELVKSINHSVSEQNRSTGEISSNMGMISEGIHKVAGAIQEMALGANNISESTGSTVGNVEDVVQEVEYLVEASSRVHDGATDTQDAAQFLADLASGLQKTLAKFKV